MSTYRPPQDVRQYRLDALRDKVREGWQTFLEPTTSGSPRLLHWDSKSDALQIWPWPCYPDGRRVPPDELQEYFCEYHARAPCCLCAYLDSSKYYTSAKISLVETVNYDNADTEIHPFIGEYVAECATGSCGYFVILERFFACKVLLNKSYTKRAYRFDMSLYDHFLSDEYLFGEKKPPTGFERVFVGPISHPDGGFSCGSNGLKRVRGDYEEEIQQSSSRLQTLVSGGLPASDFWAQFVQCAVCDHVIPRHLYPYAHRCFKRVKVLRNEDGTTSSGVTTSSSASSSSPARLVSSDTEDLLERLAREAAEEDSDDEPEEEATEKDSDLEGDSDDELTPDAVVRYIREGNSLTCTR